MKDAVQTQSEKKSTSSPYDSYLEAVIQHICTDEVT